MTRGLRAIPKLRETFMQASHRIVFLILLLIPLSALPAFSQMHRLPRAAQDSLAAKVLADSIKVFQDSLTAANSDTSSQDDTVQYSAENIRYRNDRFSLSNKALLNYKGSSLMADSIVFYNSDNVVEAMGAPLIQDPINPSIQGYRMRYNLKTKVGEIYYGSSKKGNQNFNGVEVRRQKDGEIYIARGDFSTCDLVSDKHYYFYARRMILQPKSKVLSGPVVMNIGDVPVAILPMMVMPLGTGRRSGLLQPKFGGDQAQGFYLNGLGYYWAINDYTDFLASGDLIEGQKGTFDKTNLNSTFRYNKRYEYNGSIKATSYLNEFDPSTAGYSMEYAHDQNLTPDGKQTLKGNGRFQSDPTIVDRNSITEADKVKQTANASLGYRRQFEWNQSTVNVGLLQNYALTENSIDRNIPDVTFQTGGPLFPKPDEEEGPIQLKDDPWFRKLNWGYDNHFNINQLSKPQTTSITGDSNTYVGYADHVSLSGKYSVLQYFNLTPSINVGQLWSMQRRGPTNDPVQTAFDPSQNDFGEYFSTVSTSLSLDTRIYGIAQSQGKPWLAGITGIRHTLSPSIGFTYAPKIDSNPLFLPNPKIGGTAFQAKQQTVNLSIGNDVDLKLAPAANPTNFTATNSISNTSASGLQTNSTQPNLHPSSNNSTQPKSEPYKLLSASSSANYNFAKDQQEWSDIGSSFSLYLTKSVAFTISTTHALYDMLGPIENQTTLVSPILTNYSFGWRKGIQVAGDFNSGVRVKDTRGFPTDRFEHTPWSADVNYSFAFNATRVSDEEGNPLERAFGTTGTYRHDRTHQAYGSLKLNPTAGWQMSYDTEYNFSDGRFSKHTFAFHRLMHCWEMNFNWTPVGISEGWNFNIRILELPDVKLESSDSKSRRFKS